MGFIVNLKDGSDLIANGVDALVHEGHLFVLGTRGEPSSAVAVYAPGQWVLARKDQEVTFYKDQKTYPISIDRVTEHASDPQSEG